MFIAAAILISSEKNGPDFYAMPKFNIQMVVFIRMN